MDLFTLRKDYTLEINKEEVLLVKEFKELFTIKFNSGFVGDKDGRKRHKAFKVLAYIYLVYDWQSPYTEYSEKEKHEAALADTELEEQHVKNDSLIDAAIKKYMDLQETRLVKLLKSSYEVVDKLKQYFEDVDLDERDPHSGRPLFSAKDLMSNLANLSKTVESLQQLEHMVKKEKEVDKGLRAQASPGMFD